MIKLIRAIDKEIDQLNLRKRNIEKYAKRERLEGLEFTVFSCYTLWCEAECSVVVSIKICLELIIKIIDFVGSKVSGRRVNNAPRQAIFRPPGTISILLFQTVYSKKKFERIFQQPIADMREEYYSALMLGRVKHARWIWISGVACLWLTVLADVPVSFSKLVVHLWKASQ